MRKKKINMKDIAEELGLSINSVSLALNDKPGISDDTRNTIIQTAKKLGYAYDYTPTQTDIKSICLLLNERYIVNSSFYSKIVLSIETEAKKQGIDVVVNFFNQASSDIVSCIQNKSVSGILAGGVVSESYLTNLAQFKLPLVLIDHSSFYHPFDCVVTQNIAGGFNATRHVLNKGHKKIGFFGDVNLSMSFKERWLGFNECMREHLPNDYLQIIADYSITDEISGLVIGKHFESLAARLKKLAELPTAFVCCNDETAIALYQALALMNLHVPQDISVIGFDDIDACTYVTPPLTTMSVNRELMGKLAFERLIEQIRQNEELPVQSLAVPVGFVERNSVAEIEIN